MINYRHRAGQGEQRGPVCRVWLLIRSLFVGRQYPWKCSFLVLLTCPLLSAKSVTGYMVRLERKDSNGQWLPHATLPVGAAQAESATGYTGFGAGAPPAFLSIPGAWRLSAQVTTPQPSGWSDWVEFAVMAPPSSSFNSTLKPSVKSFAK